MAGKAACVTTAVCARCWTGQTNTPAPVLIRALGAMLATLVSETVKENHQLNSSTIQSCTKNVFLRRPFVYVYNINHRQLTINNCGAKQALYSKANIEDKAFEISKKG